MPVRIPKAGSIEMLSYSVAGAAAFAPLAMLVPGFSEKLAMQTGRWAPRWERNITYFTPPVERTMQRISPPVERTVKRIDNKLPLERVARRVDRGIKKNINRFSK